MTNRTRPARRMVGGVLTVMALIVSMALPAGAKPKASGFLTDDDPFITLAHGLPGGASVKAIISSGDEIGDFVFEGLPDGIGIRPGAEKNTVDVYVAHDDPVLRDS